MSSMRDYSCSTISHQAKDETHYAADKDYISQMISSNGQCF